MTEDSGSGPPVKVSTVLPKAYSKRMASSAVIGDLQAHSAANAASSICRCAAAPTVRESAVS